MKTMVVDMQGFCIPKFHVKELSFYDGEKTAHYIFKPPKPYSQLEEDVKKQIGYVSYNCHGLKYSSGFIDYEEIKKILHYHLAGINVVYVKGKVKEEFMLEMLEDTSNCRIVNLENVRGCPKFEQNQPLCYYHSFSNRKCSCSLRNALNMYRWLIS